MKSCKIPIFIFLLLFMFGGVAHSQLIIDSVNYAIDVGDAFADAGDTVAIPLQLKNAIAVGGFLIRLTYDTTLLRPLPADGCPTDACAGYCCDSTGIDLTAIVYDSLEMVGLGNGTILIDSAGSYCSPGWDWTYTNQAFVIHDPADDSMHAEAVFVQFLPPWDIPDTNSCKFDYWGRPHIVPMPSEPTTFANIMFMVNPTASAGDNCFMRIEDYRPTYQFDPLPDYRDNQLTDTTGTIVVRPLGALGFGRFTVGEGPPDEPDWDTCTYGIGQDSYGNDTCALPSGNTPPVVNNISPSSYTVDQGVTVTFSVSASDADGDDLSLEASGLPVGASFTPSNPITGNSNVSGTFTWTPSFSQSGNFGINFQATDGPGAKSPTRSVVISVNELNIDRLFTSSAPGGSPVGGIPGATPVVFPIDLVSSRTVYGVQFDMIYPDDIVSIDSIVVTDLTPEYSVWENVGDFPDTVRVLAFGLSNEPIIEPTGSTAILNAYMTVDSNAAPGEYWINIIDAWESVDPDHTVPSLFLLADSGVVEVDRIGDVNLDTRIDVADLVNVVANIIGSYTLPKRNFETADVIQDLLVNVVDLVGIINLIYDVPVESSPVSQVSGGEIARLNVEHEDNLIDGQFTKLNVRGEFPDNIAGVQMQIDYDPSVFEFDQPELSDEAGSFTLAYNDDKSGRMQVLMYNHKPWDDDGLIPTGLADVLHLPTKIKKNLALGDNSKVKITQAYLSNSIAESIEIEELTPLVPEKFNLMQNRPNPFNPTTSIDFHLGINDAASGQQKVRLDVFNILGQQVNVLVDEYLEPGPHTVIWDGTNETG
ncbi:MAG: hypothetical protein GY865_04135, partial [candidate division Zixibacteria bacterium]|nr:hypothetical protein [candidate division Zixibacteria bacterium]